MNLQHLFKVTIDHDELPVPGHCSCILTVEVAYDVDAEDVVIDEVRCLGHAVVVDVSGNVETLLLKEAIDKADKEHLFTLHRGVPKALEVF